MDPSVRVVLVDDSDVFRESMGFLLESYPDLSVAGSVALGGDAARTCSEVAADVAVVDYRLPDLDGGEAAREIREACPGTAVVFLSASLGQDEADAARLAGAPLVGKDAGVDALVDAIRAAVGRRV